MDDKVAPRGCWVMVVDDADAGDENDGDDNAVVGMVVTGKVNL